MNNKYFSISIFIELKMQLNVMYKLKASHFFPKYNKKSKLAM